MADLSECQIKQAAAFKRGFSDYCFDAGLSKEAAESLLAHLEQVEKRAKWGRILQALKGVPGKAWGGIKRVAPAVGLGAGAAGAGALGSMAAQGPSAYAQHLLPLAMAAGGVAGLGLGHVGGNLLASAVDNADSPEEVKAKELADTYRVYADRARLNRENQSLR